MREFPVALDPASDIPEARATRRAPSPRREPEQRPWVEQLTALGNITTLPPRIQSLAVGLLDHLRAILRENTELAERAIALEHRLLAGLAERVRLGSRIALLEGHLDALRQERADEQALLGQLSRELEYARRHPARAERPPIALYPPTQGGPSAAGGPGLRVAPAPEREIASSLLHFQHPISSDEETLLGDAFADPPMGAGRREVGPGPNGGVSATDDVMPDPTVGSYALIAHPFARFSDLGQFQTAIQALPGVHNVRVRRFAQGTLEMRVDYDGTTPLTTLLRGLPLSLDAVVQEESFRLRIHLAATGTY